VVAYRYLYERCRGCNQGKGRSDAAQSKERQNGHKNCKFSIKKKYSMRSTSFILLSKVEGNSIHNFQAVRRLAT
jgi:hypothetical protein